MRLAAVSLLSLLCACAPAAVPSDDGPGGKADDADDGAVCAPSELETLGLCISEGCPGLTGASLEICLQETCGEDLQYVADDCESCVRDGVDAGDDLSSIADACGTKAAPMLCSATDLEWLFLCRDEGCPDAADLETCLVETCGAEIEAMSAACRGCFVEQTGESASPDLIEATCSELPVACTGEDAEIVELCLSEGCPDRTGASLEVCLQETCGEDLDYAADECAGCVFDNVDGGAAGIGQSCLP